MKRFGIIVLAVAICGLSRFGFGQVTITEIAQTGDPVPGTEGTFESFGLPSADREAIVLANAGVHSFAFQATSSNGNSGVYSYGSTPGYAPSLGVSIDTTMPAPTGGFFTGFPNISFGYDEFGLTATTSAGAALVMEGDEEDSVLNVVTQSGQSPAPGITFGGIQNISLMGQFNEFGTNPLYIGEGVFESDGAIYSFTRNYSGTYPNITASQTFQLLANSSTIPQGGSAPFTSFGPVSFKAGWNSNFQGRQDNIIAFRANVGATEGIYYAVTFRDGWPTSFLKLADTAAPSIVQFTSFGDPVASSSDIDFLATYNSTSGPEQGVFDYGSYADFGNVETLHEVAATGGVAPGAGGAHFLSFVDLAANGVFVAKLDDGQEGLYDYGPTTDFGTQASPNGFCILDTTQELDGKSISGIEVSPEALSDDDLVFKVDFTDGSEGLYYWNLQVPEPGMLVVPLLAISLLRPYRSAKSWPNHPMA